jgi:hypothetical protein
VLAVAGENEYLLLIRSPWGDCDLRHICENTDRAGKLRGGCRGPELVAAPASGGLPAKLVVIAQAAAVSRIATIHVVRLDPVTAGGSITPVGGSYSHRNSGSIGHPGSIGGSVAVDGDWRHIPV